MQKIVNSYINKYLFHSETTRRGRVANGAASPPAPAAAAAAAAMSPRRRGRQRVDDTDHFTAFYNKAQENNYNVVVQVWFCTFSSVVGFRR